MDEVIVRCGRRCLRGSENKKYVEKSIVRPVYGFDYHKHFRRMLVQLLGIVNVERLERRVDSNLRASLVATLSSLKSARDSQAHTHLKGMTVYVNAPSVTLGQFRTVYEGLKEYERIIREIRW